jgi:hypothetical protein
MPTARLKPVPRSTALPRPPQSEEAANSPFRGRLQQLQRRLPWPLPALLNWSLAWGLFTLAGATGLPAVDAFLIGCLPTTALALLAESAWRRAILALGFPLSMALQTWLHGTVLWADPALQGLEPIASAGLAGSLPAWAWLLPVGLLALAYPVRAWRDAPFFPTPVDALEGLQALAPIDPGARVLDAGCGLGHGLNALRRVFPQARLEGIEWSWPLTWAARLRAPWARISRGDMWERSWSDCQMVYLFQRPESMPHAARKAAAEMRPGSWLVSLEFKAPGLRLHAVVQREGHRPVWIYAVGREAKRAAPMTGR